ncbi:MAG: prolipoprotein diacylglyceryl transferase [Flavobacteriales bacterium]|jgi:prolipoprotein diacylglyceryltransferase|nr:prolipoprotein diacylglyceryl transferase [Flavobacteriales bacterium]
MPIEIPFEPAILGVQLNVHLILEYLAFFVAFRYYVFLRKRTEDVISSNNRLSIVLGAALGALIGSRVVGILENPLLMANQNWLELMNTKTIMGGLFGGLLGVELAKKIIGEQQSSGDLFTFPIIVGIFIGRIGCFLMGIKEFTYGKATTFFMGMDLGDGISRHPIALYELFFLMVLFWGLKKLNQKQKLAYGLTFQWFMIAYFLFRFFIEFLKPNEFLLLGLSTIQYLCILCVVYYHKTIINVFRNAN